MIFVTVGTQLPFDRLISAVDRWAARSGWEVFAQTGPGELVPQHVDHRDFLPADEHRRRMLAARAVVAHAGIGTILGALELGKPTVVMPRRAALGEHRNDHQLATVRRFSGLPGIAVALDEHELAQRLDELGEMAGHRPIPRHASDQLITTLRRFIAERRPDSHRPLVRPRTR